MKSKFFQPSELQKGGDSSEVKLSVAHLVLQARTQDQVIVGHGPAPRHTHAFGLPVDAQHLSGHRGDTEVQRQLGQVSAAACVAADSSRNLHPSYQGNAAKGSSENFDVFQNSLPLFDVVFYLVDRNPTCSPVGSVENPCVEMRVRLLNFR